MARLDSKIGNKGNRVGVGIKKWRTNGGFGEHRCEKAIDRVGGANQIYRPAPAQNRAE